MKVFVGGMLFWGEAVEQTVQAAGCEVTFTMADTIAQTAEMFTAIEAERNIDIVILHTLHADPELTINVIRALRQDHPQIIVIGVCYPGQYANIQQAGCHEIVVDSDVAVVPALVRMYARGARAFNPA